MIKRTAQVLFITACLVVGYGSMLASIPATDAKNPHPSGAIGDPLVGTPTPTGWLAPAIHSHKKPPREHLTMPPTDTN